MKSIKAIPILENVLAEIRELPEALEVCNIWLEGNGGTDGPVITLFESFFTAPREFNLHAEGKGTIHKRSHDEKYEALYFDTERGVRLEVLIRRGSEA